MRLKRWLPLAALAGGVCALPWGLRATRNWRPLPASAEADAQRVVARQTETGEEPEARSEAKRSGLAAPSARPADPQPALRPPENAQARAERGIGHVERIVSDKNLSPGNADAFRAQMAPRLVAAGADRAVVQAWLARTAPAMPPRPAGTADAAPAAEPQRSPSFDLSKLTPEEREVIGMNANFIHATSLTNR